MVWVVSFNEIYYERLVFIVYFNESTNFRVYIVLVFITVLIWIYIMFHAAMQSVLICFL